MRKLMVAVEIGACASAKLSLRDMLPCLSRKIVSLRLVAALGTGVTSVGVGDSEKLSKTETRWMMKYAGLRSSHTHTRQPR